MDSSAALLCELPALPTGSPAPLKLFVEGSSQRPVDSQRVLDRAEFHSSSVLAPVNDTRRPVAQSVAPVVL